MSGVAIRAQVTGLAHSRLRVRVAYHEVPSEPPNRHPKGRQSTRPVSQPTLLPHLLLSLSSPPLISRALLFLPLPPSSQVLRVKGTEFRFSSHPETDASLCDAFTECDLPAALSPSHLLPSSTPPNAAATGADSPTHPSCAPAAATSALAHVGNVSRKLSVLQPLDEEKKAKYKSLSTGASKTQTDRRMRMVEAAPARGAAGAGGWPGRRLKERFYRFYPPRNEST